MTSQERRTNLKASMTKGLCSWIERYAYESWRQGYRRFFKKEIARNFAHTYCPREAA